MSDSVPRPGPKAYGHDYDPANKLDALAMELERKLSDVIYDRGTIDTRMVEDLRNYHGQYDAETTKKLKTAKRANPFIKLTRAKTNAGESQLVDLLFPNDDKNWGIEPTPVPELAGKVNDDSPAVIGGEKFNDSEGNVITQGDLAARELEIIRESCGKMEDEIDDQLIEAQYNAKCRSVIHDGCVIGTGILKAPVVVGKLDKVYQRGPDGSFNLIMQESMTPGCEVVRPWDFFPDLSASNIREAEFVFERRYMSKQQVASLDKRRGFSKEQINKVLAMQPKQTQHHTSYQDDVRILAGLSDTLNDTRFETWEYHGPISYDVLIDLGAITLPEDSAERESFLLEHANRDAMAIVFYCGGIVLGARLQLMEYENNFPYRVWNWEPDDSSIFGYGIPRMVRDEQAILNSVWRMILDNGSITAGPQIGRNKKHIRPADGEWTIEPFKQWDMIGSVDDIRKVFTAVEFNSHLPELQGIYQIARVMFDEVSGVPMLQQGEQGQSSQTLGGMSMLMNAANTVRRRQVKAWDDDITQPTIEDLYHWNMQYGEDNDIKGDYQVDARGTSALLVRETQSVALTNFMTVAGGNPVFAPVMQLKAVQILRQWAKMQGLPSDIVPSDEELDAYQKQLAEQQGDQPQDPAIMVEQLRAQQLQAKQDFDREMFERKAQQDALEAEANRQLKLQQMQSDMLAAASKERIELIKLEQNGKLGTEKLLAELRKVQMNVEKENMQFIAELQLKQRTGNNEANYGLAQ